MLSLAQKVALASEQRQRHGAVITKGGRVMAVGINKFRNDPAVVPADQNEHGRATIFSVCAERDALSRVVDARGAVVYVARVSSQGPALSRPCSICRKALKEAGVKAVVYTS